MSHICHIIGTRPHMMKLAPVYASMKTAGINQSIIHTGQHYSEALSRDFMTELNIPHPDINLKIARDNAAQFLGDCISAIGTHLQSLTSDLVLVYGDTDSTLAGALAAAKCNLALAHVEAGLREDILSIPEEVNKRSIDAISQLLFAPSALAVERLQLEKVLGQVFFTGDVTYDLLKSLQGQFQKQWSKWSQTYDLSSEDYYLATCHRAINTDHKSHLEQILSALAQADKKVVLALHPRTSNAIKKYHLEHLIDYDKIISLGPLPYSTTQALLSHCKACITDSGGLIKEAYFHKKRAIILDTQTEWQELVDQGLHKVAGPNKEKILMSLDEIKQSVTLEPDIYGSGNAADLITQHCIDFINAN